MDERSIALRAEGDADCICSAEVVLAGDVWGAAEKRLVKHCGIAGDCPISRTMA